VFEIPGMLERVMGPSSGVLGLSPGGA